MIGSPTFIDSENGKYTVDKVIPNYRFTGNYNYNNKGMEGGASFPLVLTVEHEYEDELHLYYTASNNETPSITH